MQLTRFSRPRGERGSVAIVVALLLGPVLLGIGALVVDVGALYSDRRQQQNAADASSLAVAHDCAVTLTSCIGVLGQPLVTAQTYASGGSGVPGTHYGAGGANSSHADYVCGSATGLTPCTPSQAADCVGPAPVSPYVQVRASTANGAGTSTLLPSRFASALAGGPDPGHATRACARAAYGGVRATTALAVTVSYCEWNTATTNGTSFAPPPPYPPKPPTSVEHVLLLHTTSGLGGCSGGPSGWDLPGGFGWLDDPSGTCSVFVDITGTYGDNTGVSAGQSCKDRIAAAAVFPSSTPIYLPVYDGAGGTGHGGTYHLRGFAAFVVTGYWLPSSHQKSWLTNKYPCGAPNVCISGFFTQGLVPAGGTLGGPPMGASIVSLVG